ncbi:MAG TPA: TetR/AcrR family transcriptional regulator [Solirubrobacterales bacterium]|nr:TetR/AcrR family transcriptional regulator [Solirubrobacterales bacterium]
MAGSASHPTTPTDIGELSQRQRIIDAMIESCAEKTYAATTITDIVAGARISRTTFYKRFDGKRECFEAAVAHCIEQLRDLAASAHSPSDPPADAARKAATAVLEAMAARPGLAQLLTGDAIAVDPMAIERYRAVTIPALEALWSERGAIPEPRLDPRLAFGQVQVLILNQIAIGRADGLPDLLPEIVYLAVGTFGGHEEAVRQARLAREQAPTARQDDVG